MNPHRRYDVVIAGGGLGGLALARQLALRQPNLSVAVIDRLERPLPEAAFKVGESTVEVAAHYFGTILQLTPYLERHQLRKFGLRYFMAPGTRPLHERGEWGTDRLLPVPSYQLDRGTFEHDLRGMVEEDGTTLYEGHRVADITLGCGTDDHRIELVDTASGVSRELRCGWVVDAMGRRRFLQSKLGLQQESPHRASAAWFRMPGRLDIDDLVDRGRTDYHRRVPGGMRYFSTNHLLGTGYWVWLIPLASGNTSVGIVTDERIHPCQSYSTPGAAFHWLDRHEPQLADYLRNRPLLDFKALRNFSYLSKQVFSIDRWSCVGEAGVFLDPFYSPGSDTIAIGNLITERLVVMQRQQTLTAGAAKGFDRFFRAFIDTFLETYTNRYVTFGSPRIAAAKVTWDTCLYWAWTGQFVFRDLLSRADLIPELLEYGSKLSILHKRVQDLLSRWAIAGPAEREPDFSSPYDIPLFRQLHDELIADCSPEAMSARLRANLARFEEWAIRLFFEAVEDVYPDLLSEFQASRWVNAWAISLEPANWERDGLFEPSTPPRSLDAIVELLNPRTAGVPSL